MTYLYEYQVQGDTVRVEYCFSAVSESIKVVDMWVNGKFHRVNWMSHEGRDKLMARLEQDMEDRMCGTLDDVTVGTEIDLDRDMPGFEGTWETLNAMVENGMEEVPNA